MNLKRNGVNFLLMSVYLHSPWNRKCTLYSSKKLIKQFVVGTCKQQQDAVNLTDTWKEKLNINKV